MSFKTIGDLNRYCKKKGKSIIVKRGKLKGMANEPPRVGKEYKKVMRR